MELVPHKALSLSLSLSLSRLRRMTLGRVITHVRGHVTADVRVSKFCICEKDVFHCDLLHIGAVK